MLEKEQKDPPLASPIVIGIAGHRHIDATGENLEKLQRGLRVVFRAFSAEILEEDSPDEEQQRARKLREELGFPHEMITEGLPKRNPVWLLSPMAVGSDTLAAVEAHRFYRGETEFSERQITTEDDGGEEIEAHRSFKIVAPLAKPLDFPRESDEEVPDPSWGEYGWPIDPGTVPAGDEGSVPGVLKKIRGKLPPDESDESDGYAEYVLPLGGRAVLQRHTTYGEDDFPLWVAGKFEKPAERKAAFPNGPLRWDDRCSPEAVELMAGAESREHYRTGATYVALYCDVLVALWDGKFYDDSVGTDAAVSIKLTGPDPDAISHGPIFNWADAGPVIQVLAENLRPDSRGGPETAEGIDSLNFKPQAASTEEREDRAASNGEIGDTKVLHPSDCAPADETGELEVSPEEHGTKIFCRMLEATTCFNEEIQGSKDFEGYFPLDFLPEEEKRGEKDPGFDQADSIDRKLQRIARFAKATDALAGQLKEQLTNRFSILFLMVGAAAVVFDFYAHLYVEYTSGGAPSHSSWWLLFFIVTVICALLIFHWCLHKPRLEARFLEYRSLAEAFRVQLAWLGAGIPQSAALHYLQRHRGSLDWIRDTLASWCFPYEDGQRRFDAPASGEEEKSAQRKLARLYYVREKWVRDQLIYFKGAGENPGAAEREGHQHHVNHIMGLSTALVGFSAALLLLCGEIPCKCPLGPLDSKIVITLVFFAGITAAIVALRLLHRMHSKSHGSVAVDLDRRWLISLAAIALLSPVVTGLLHSGWHAYHPPEIGAGLARWIIYGTTILGALLFLLLRFIPKKKMKRFLAKASKTGEKICERCRIRSARIRSWSGGLAEVLKNPEQMLLPYIPFGISMVAYISFGLVHFWAPDPHECEFAAQIVTEYQQTSPPAAPHGEESSAGQSDDGAHSSGTSPGLSYILLIGLPILWGALLVAWGEKQLHSEHANRYHTAGELFRLTDQRLEALLGQAADALKNSEMERFETAVIRAQDVIYALGKEALSENAEWLLLHRARPLEFPMAG